MDKLKASEIIEQSCCGSLLDISKIELINEVKRLEDIEIKHELKVVDMSHYTNQMWFDKIDAYLTDVMGMNKEQRKKEFDNRFPDLLDRGLDL